MSIEIGKQNLININNESCYVISDGLERVLLISFVILGFLIMKFFLSGEKENTQLSKDKESKSKMVEEYLEKYRKENEDFFFTSEENTA
jgi:hypothetical protein